MTGVNTAKKKVTISDGSTISYNALLLATGGRWCICFVEMFLKIMDKSMHWLIWKIVTAVCPFKSRYNGNCVGICMYTYKGVDAHIYVSSSLINCFFTYFCKSLHIHPILDECVHFLSFYILVHSFVCHADQGQWLYQART